MSESILPSGAKLKIQLAPFAVSRNLWKAILKEMKTIEIDLKGDVAGLLKDLFCAGFSSPEIELCLKECFERCTVDGLKIDDDTFEPANRRQDYLKVCAEVVRENVLPFGRALMQEYKTASAIVTSIQA